MSDVQFDVVFRGVRGGFDTAQVQAKFAQLFSLDAAKVAALFAAPATRLKSGVSELVAAQYIARLAAIGVEAEAIAQVAPAVELAAPAAVVTEPEPLSYQRDAQPAPEPDVAEPALGATARHAVSTTTLPFVFSGKGFEYFKIWIVNILLTLVTLGIYSAWAKVRNHQYFYGNTKLNDSTFEYTAKPLQILKGRVIAFILLIAYSVLTKASPMLAGILGLVFLLALPWIVVKSLQFNARSTSYRNIAFRFQGGIGGAAKAFILWPILGVLSLGILMPLAWKKQLQYTIGNHAYGTSRFGFDVSVKEYYKMLGMILVCSLVVAGLFKVLVGDSFVEMMEGGASSLLTVVLVVCYLAFYLLVSAYFIITMANIQWNNSQLQAHKFKANWSVGSYARLLFTNTLFSLLTLGLYIPFAKVKVAAYKAAHTEFVAQGELNEFIAAEKEQVSALGEGVNDLFDVDVSI
jgi:uncharacterized membrane protein YjgN (DUF898 family)